MAGEAGDIQSSFATGDVSGGIYNGGLAGIARATSDSYAMGSVASTYAYSIGGLIGWSHGNVERSYSVGGISRSGSHYYGGLIGFYESFENAYSYWDLDTSGISDPAKGCGNSDSCPGVIGLTDPQFKSGLPPGFDPNIWDQSPNINNGYPYLRANPPQ